MSKENYSMKVIVITGSSRGIGYGLADSFLDRGHAVIVSGRGQETTQLATEKLAEKYRDEKIVGQPCDVREPEQVQNLWDSAQEHFGKVDIWINNAGVANLMKEVWRLTAEEIDRVIRTTLSGAIYGSVVALRGMLQQGFGSLYFMEGMGSDGRKLPGLTIYGTTKYGLHYYIESVVKETQDTPIIVGSISPGMVLTGMLEEQYQENPEELERAKRVFNLLADRVETVTPWLAERILTNEKKGTQIVWLTKRKLVGRMISSVFRKRKLFE
jgi:NAD(P)-dependent dehydrogenase (short-subunit alcohol dehydrogenase family)